MQQGGAHLPKARRGQSDPFDLAHAVYRTRSTARDLLHTIYRKWRPQMMTPDSLPHTDGDILNVPDGHMRAAQAKWSRLTQEDLSSIRDEDDLVAKIEERYSLPHRVAVQDVQLWIRATAHG
jgi:hypothetical protein